MLPAAEPARLRPTWNLLAVLQGWRCGLWVAGGRYWVLQFYFGCDRLKAVQQAADLSAVAATAAWRVLLGDCVAPMLVTGLRLLTVYECGLDGAACRRRSQQD